MPWGYAAAAVGSYLAADSQKGSAEDAANATSESSQLGIEEQRRQFDQIQQMLAPFVNAGTGALGAQQDLLGLSGAGAQQAAIGGIESSPMFQAITRQGEDAILANGSATGGLRGGNVQRSLAEFRPQLLAQIIEQRMSQLGGLTSLGQNAAAGVGNAGMQTGNQITTLLGQQGAAQAGAALADGRANSQLINGLTSTFGSYMGGKF